MDYDLLIKHGRIVDGSGMPAFRGDVGVRNGKIAELGKLSGSAKRTLDAAGRVIAPGFVDNHCHFDAQVTWDLLILSAIRRHHAGVRQVGPQHLLPRTRGLSAALVSSWIN